MLNTAKLIAFSATTNAGAARRFYESVLGLRVIAEDDFALVLDANGTTLRLQKVEHLSPAPFTALGWEVPDVQAAARQLARQGVHFEKYPWLAQDEHGIWTSPSGACVAWFKDPDGNTLSITQHAA